MKTNSISFDQIVNRLAVVLNSEKLLKEYNHEGQQSMMMGWAYPAAMFSPVTRTAFIAAFGLATVEKAEEAARAMIEDAAADADLLHYQDMTDDADRAATTDDAPELGAHVWGHTSGLKNEGGGLSELVRAMLRHEVDPQKWESTGYCELCQIEKVYHVTAEQFADPDLADDLTARGGMPGGTTCFTFNEGTPLEEKKYMTHAAAIVAPSGAWYLADAEGYDYCRYILMPTTWRTMFAAETAKQRAALEAKKKAREDKEAADRAARRAAYDAKCQKWAGLMTEIEPLLEAENAAYKTGDKKAKKSASAKLAAARRGNIKAMILAAFPGLKVSIRSNSHWGADWKVTYYDGPTEEEFNKAVNLDLFCSSYDTFCGYDDSTDTVRKEFTEFANKYMMMAGGEVKATREMTDEKRAELLEAVCAAVPGLEDAPHDFTTDEQTAICEVASARYTVPADFSRHDVFKGQCLGESNCYPSSVVLRLFHRISFLTAQKPHTPTTPGGRPTVKADRQKPATATENGQNDATPADGLALVEIAGGVAVVGDSRTTYKNRKSIKSHGARWNKAAARWEATTPEAVASVRAWFGLTEATTTAEDAPTTATATDAPATAQEVTTGAPDSPTATTAPTTGADAPQAGKTPVIGSLKNHRFSVGDFVEVLAVDGSRCGCVGKIIAAKLVNKNFVAVCIREGCTAAQVERSRLLPTDKKELSLPSWLRPGVSIRTTSRSCEVDILSVGRWYVNTSSDCRFDLGHIVSDFEPYNVPPAPTSEDAA